MKTFQDFMYVYNKEFKCYHHQKDYRLFLNCSYKSIVVTVQLSPMDVETIKARYDDVDRHHVESIIFYYIKALINKMYSNKQYIRLKKFECLI